MREIDAILRGEQKRRIREHDDARSRNYELANLISYAWHDPKKMPKFEPTKQPTKRDPAVDEARMKAYFRALAKRGT